MNLYITRQMTLNFHSFWFIEKNKKQVRAPTPDLFSFCNSHLLYFHICVLSVIFLCPSLYLVWCPYFLTTNRNDLWPIGENGSSKPPIYTILKFCYQNVKSSEILDSHSSQAFTHCVLFPCTVVCMTFWSSSTPTCITYWPIKRFINKIEAVSLIYDHALGSGMLRK